jgi:hypothetical protein
MGIPQEVRQPGREADNLSNAEVKKHESITSTPRNPDGLVRFSADETSDAGN